jgi:hypothetical protein
MVLERGIIYEAAMNDAEKMGMKVQDYLEDTKGEEVPTAGWFHYTLQGGMTRICLPCLGVAQGRPNPSSTATRS